MAVAAKLVERLSPQQFRVTWTLAAAGDTGSPFRCPSNASAVFQIVSAGAVGGTVFFFDGVNDSVAGTAPTPPGTTSSPWAIETAGVFGTTSVGCVQDNVQAPITGTLGAADYIVPSVPVNIDTLPLWVQPRLAAGGGSTDIKVVLLVNQRGVGA